MFRMLNINLRFPWVKRLPKTWVLNMATLGPIGRMGRAPGTMGSIVGVLIYTLFFYPLPGLTYLLLLAAIIYAAVGICDEGAQLLQAKDPSEFILDECVAMPLCFIGLDWAMEKYPMWLILLAGLAVFRFFDILKPLGLRWLQQFRGGGGIVIDDLAAALATSIVLHLGLFIFA